jgi:N-acetylglucosaminyl-diphospho-decaprenol L-rhamnosyltransferase
MTDTQRGRPVVRVVTVTHNSQAAIGAFLDSIPAASVHPTPVTVVDNRSEDPEAIRAIVDGAGAEWVGLDRNAGYGSGVRAGIEAGPVADYYLISNPDVVLGAATVDVLVAAAEEEPLAGAVGPKILTSDYSVYPSARNLPSLANGVGHALVGSLFPNNRWSREYRADTQYSEERRTAGWLSGACLLIRREAWEAVGGFDDRYFMYFEDVDLGERLTRSGWTNLYVPGAVVIHSGAHSTSKSRREMSRAHHDSAYRYLVGRYPKWYQAPLRWALRVGLEARWRLFGRK